MDAKARDAREHVRCVANKMNLASRDIKPIDRVFNHRGSGFGQGDEKFNIESEALLMKPALDGFVTFASHNLEAALRIVDRDSGN